MDYMKNLSKNLRALRGEKTLIEFSQELGITKSTLQAIEKGNSVVRLDTLEVICWGSRMPVEALLGDELTSIEANILYHVLRDLAWFTDLSVSEQRKILHWAGETLELFSELSMKP